MKQRVHKLMDEVVHRCLTIGGFLTALRAIFVKFRQWIMTIQTIRMVLLCRML
jgi:hypothetical protein